MHDLILKMMNSQVMQIHEFNYRVIYLLVWSAMPRVLIFYIVLFSSHRISFTTCLATALHLTRLLTIIINDSVL
ncbi:hypothetical protein VTL71DRAFT_371 [Oculimacula yallundae]|uniref:Uncharacterized protein n=1 Tax=Oculimacula yallundae TaxID=86028 RepID=A0ABR4D1C2_9HELO